MRPRLYFVLGSILAIAGLMISFSASIFFVSIIRFVLRNQEGYRIEQLLFDFPWWAPILAILGLLAGILLIRKYDFSYKTKFWVLSAGLVAATLTAGWAADASGIDKVWIDRGPMQGIMKQYRQENRIKEQGAQSQNQKRIQNQEQNQNLPQTKNQNQVQSQPQGQSQNQNQVQTQNQNQTQSQPQSQAQGTNGDKSIQGNEQDLKKVNSNK